MILMILSLIARLEREPDADTWHAINSTACKLGWISNAKRIRNVGLIQDASDGDELDAELLIPVALSWMPEGWQDRIGLMKTAMGKWVCSVELPSGGGIGNATTAALALALAILKARMAMGEDSAIAKATQTSGGEG